jgi:hypothetical protein
MATSQTPAVGRRRLVYTPGVVFPSVFALLLIASILTARDHVAAKKGRTEDVGSVIMRPEEPV